MWLLLMGLVWGGEPTLSVRSSADWVVFEIQWADDTDDALGQTKDGRALGDNSSIHFDFDGDGSSSFQDKRAKINMWPAYPGLYLDDFFEGGGSKARPSHCRQHRLVHPWRPPLVVREKAPASMMPGCLQGSMS